MRLREITTSARTSVDHAVDRVANQDQVQAVRRFAKLERVLAGLCLFIPVLLIAFDSGSIRDSISAYFDMDQNQIFYYPLTVAAMLFVVNGVIKHKHSYNAVLGLMLSGVILFNHNDAGVLHTVFTVAFFGGNAVVILLFSEGTLRRYKEIFVLGIVAAMTAYFVFDWFTLFWAEWLSFIIIAAHYILDSWDRDCYNAVPRHSPAT